jgi:predicted RNA polymerase sigma factor
VSPDVDPDDLAAVYRREVGRCTATLVRVLGDVDQAEDAVAEAFAIAAERWSVGGVPPNPWGLDHHHGAQRGDRSPPARSDP